MSVSEGSTGPTGYTSSEMSSIVPLVATPVVDSKISLVEPVTAAGKYSPKNSDIQACTMSPPCCPLEEAVPAPDPVLVEILPSDRLSICHKIGSVRPSERTEPPLRVTRIWFRSALPVSADCKMLSDPLAFIVKIWWRRLYCGLRPGGTGWLGVPWRSSASGCAQASM